MPTRELELALQDLNEARRRLLVAQRDVAAITARRDRALQDQARAQQELERIEAALGRVPLGARQTLLVPGSFKTLETRAQEIRYYLQIRG